LDKFIHEKFFQEIENEIPHLEGRVLIMDQYVESSYEAISPLHESPTIDDTLSDLIDKIERRNLDSIPTHSTEQSRPS